MDKEKKNIEKENSKAKDEIEKEDVQKQENGQDEKQIDEKKTDSEDQAEEKLEEDMDDQEDEVFENQEEELIESQEVFEEDYAEEKDSEEASVKKKLGIFVGSVLVLAYILGSIFFTMNTFPKTYVNGEDRGLVSKSNVFEVSNDDKFTVKANGREGHELEVSGEEIDYRSEIKGKPELKQNAFLWPFEIFKDHQYNIEFNTRFSADKLADIIKQSKLATIRQEPVNATLEEQNGQYVIVDEKPGTKLDLEKTVEAFAQAFEKGITEVDLEPYYENPTVKSDDPKLAEERDRINDLYTKNYVFDFVDRKWELTGQDLLDMYEDIDGQFVLNTEKLSDYVAQIARETDTYNKKRKFNATDLGEITVEGAIYGWQMNVSNTVSNLLAMINEGKDGQVEIAYNRTALHRETNDIGDTYIEIDLSRQKMWMYKNGELLVETEVVSGMGSNIYGATPVGVGEVWYKETDTELVGINQNYGNEYVYPVKYWMPFSWSNAGIHDAYSRNQFGGDIYINHGSSGCVNTPLKAMETIFENTPYGCPVVVYESSTNYSPTEFERQALQRERENQD